MRCEKAQDLFSDYCEGNVQRALLVPLEDHLIHCTSCRGQVDELYDTWSMLDSAIVVEPPANFHASVWQRIDEHEQEMARRGSRWFDMFRIKVVPRPALAWAASLMIVLALAGVSVPGRHIAARLGIIDFPFSQQTSAAIEITAPSFEGNSTVHFTLTNHLVETIQGTSTVLCNGVTINKPFTLAPDGKADISLSSQQFTATSSARIKVTWQYGSETYSRELRFNN